MDKNFDESGLPEQKPYFSALTPGERLAISREIRKKEKAKQEQKDGLLDQNIIGLNRTQLEFPKQIEQIKTLFLDLPKLGKASSKRIHYTNVDSHIFYFLSTIKNY